MVLLEVAPSTGAGIVTAIATVITALGGLILAIAVLIPNLRTTRTIHTIVNQQRTDAQRYNIALSELLKKHGIEVPIDQSLPVSGVPDAKPGEPT
jgi:predicted amino acid-binding ACT domain protein